MKISLFPLTQDVEEPQAQMLVANPEADELKLKTPLKDNEIIRVHFGINPTEILKPSN